MTASETSSTPSPEAIRRPQASVSSSIRPGTKRVAAGGRQSASFAHLRTHSLVSNSIFKQSTTASELNTAPRSPRLADLDGKPRPNSFIASSSTTSFTSIGKSPTVNNSLSDSGGQVQSSEDSENEDPRIPRSMSSLSDISSKTFPDRDDGSLRRKSKGLDALRSNSLVSNSPFKQQFQSPSASRTDLSLRGGVRPPTTIRAAAPAVSPSSPGGILTSRRLTGPREMTASPSRVHSPSSVGAVAPTKAGMQREGGAEQRRDISAAIRRERRKTVTFDEVPDVQEFEKESSFESSAASVSVYDSPQPSDPPAEQRLNQHGYEGEEETGDGYYCSDEGPFEHGSPQPAHAAQEGEMQRFFVPQDDGSPRLSPEDHQLDEPDLWEDGGALGLQRREPSQLGNEAMSEDREGREQQCRESGQQGLAPPTPMIGDEDSFSEADSFLAEKALRDAVAAARQQKHEQELSRAEGGLSAEEGEGSYFDEHAYAAELGHGHNSLERDDTFDLVEQLLKDEMLSPRLGPIAPSGSSVSASASSASSLGALGSGASDGASTAEDGDEERTKRTSDEEQDDGQEQRGEQELDHGLNSPSQPVEHVPTLDGASSPSSPRPVPPSPSKLQSSLPLSLPVWSPLMFQGESESSVPSPLQRDDDRALSTMMPPPPPKREVDQPPSDGATIAHSPLSEKEVEEEPSRDPPSPSFGRPTSPDYIPATPTRPTAGLVGDSDASSPLRSPRSPPGRRLRSGSVTSLRPRINREDVLERMASRRRAAAASASSVSSSSSPSSGDEKRAATVAADASWSPSKYTISLTASLSPSKQLVPLTTSSSASSIASPRPAVVEVAALESAERDTVNEQDEDGTRTASEEEPSEDEMPPPKGRRKRTISAGPSAPGQKTVTLERVVERGSRDDGATGDEGDGESGLESSLSREFSLIQNKDRKYRVRDRGLYASATDKVSHSRQAGDVDSGKAWRTVRRPSDMNEYARELREYRSKENPQKAAGKVFVKIDSFTSAGLPVPSLPTFFNCTLDNGIHCVETEFFPLEKSGPSNIKQEFELINHKNLEFSLTLTVRRDAHLRPPPPKPQPTSPSKGSPSGGSRMRGLFGAQKRANKSASSAKDSVRNPASTAPVDPLVQYLNAQGVFGRSFVVFSNLALRCTGRLLEVELPVVNTGSNELPREPGRNQHSQAKRVGTLRVHLFYLPPMPAVVRGDLPNSLNDCIKGLGYIAWHNGQVWYEGTLTQQGGDCPTWRRRPIKAKGGRLICWSDVLNRAVATIDLSKAIRVEDNDDPVSSPRGPATGNGGRGTPASRIDEEEEVYHMERSFRVVFMDGEEISFFADTDEEKRRWLKVLNSLVGRIPPKPLWAQLAAEASEAAEKGLQELQELQKRQGANPAANPSEMRSSSHAAGVGHDNKRRAFAAAVAADGPSTPSTIATTTGSTTTRSTHMGSSSRLSTSTRPTTASTDGGRSRTGSSASKPAWT